jgi:hypothetical protein
MHEGVSHRHCRRLVTRLVVAYERLHGVEREEGQLIRMSEIFVRERVRAEPTSLPGALCHRIGAPARITIPITSCGDAWSP